MQKKLCSIILLPALLLFLLLSLNPSRAAAEELYFTILHTNDEHGSLIPHSASVDFHPYRDNPTIGGYARLATAVNQIREQKSENGEPVLLFSAGDFIGGSPYSWLVPRGFVYEILIKHEIGYNAVVVGNHEYDYGANVLADYLLSAGYPAAHAQTVVLASNSVVPPDHPLGRHGLFRETRVIDLPNGLKVGLFGLIGKQAISYTTNHDPVTFRDQHETAGRMVAALQEQDVDVIIAITHANVEEDRELALAVPGIHVIVGGHSHDALYEPVFENDTVIVQAGSLLEYMGCLELAYDPESGLVRVRNEESETPYLHRLDSSYEMDPAIGAMIEEATEELNGLVSEMTGGLFTDVLDVVAYSDFVMPNVPPRQESPFGNFIADAMRLVTEEKTGKKAHVAVQANGSIRGTLNPGSMAHSMGKISFYDIAELIGLGIGPDGDAGYPIVAAYLTGEEIYRALEVAVILSELMGDTFFLQFSGLRYEYNPQNAILLTVPFLDLPIPSTRAVLSAEMYIGEGRQGQDDDLYVPIVRGDDQLYCLVTDSYIVSFLPMVGDMLPSLDLVLKDEAGNPVPDDELDRLIVMHQGRELKVWQTVIEYAAAQPVGSTGLPEIDSYYATPAGRIVAAWSIPLITWPVLALILMLALIVWLIRRRRLRKKRLAA